jgi:hypothetical protein
VPNKAATGQKKRLGLLQALVFIGFLVVGAERLELPTYAL